MAGALAAGAPLVVVAEQAGACYGVERALGQVREAMRQAVGRVCTLGPLIHNPVVVADLADAGVTAIDTPQDAADATLVLRTHGVTPAEERLARDVCASVIDATCPFVVRTHRAAAELASAGYQVLVVGEADHPEVAGTLAHAEGAVAVGCARDLDSVTLEGRVGVVVQTTQTRARLQEVIDALVARGTVRDLRLVDTICEATAQRQDAAARLAGRADVMVVVGGRNSANTRHLAELCAERCASTHHVETVAELDGAWFDGVAVIGITAGASTPREQVDETLCAVRRLAGA